jgi:hypothetical protein
LNFIGRPIKYFPKYTKEEIDQIISSSFPQPSTSKEDKLVIQVFNNILDIEGFLKSEIQTLVSPSKSQPSSPPKAHTMVLNQMDIIISTRYAPLVLSQVLSVFPVGDYMKYFPRFNGEGDVMAIEQLAPFYNFADNFNMEQSVTFLIRFARPVLKKKQLYKNSTHLEIFLFSLPLLFMYYSAL